MRKTRQLCRTVPGGTTLCLLLFIYAMALVPAHASDDTKQTSPAQDFTLKSNTGKNIKLSELRGQVILLNFWASWCGTCIQQLNILEKFNRQYKDKGFIVLGVNIDKETRKASSIATKSQINFPILFDTYNHISQTYSVSSIPVSLLIDRDGNIRYSLNATKINQQKKTRQLIEGLLYE